VTVAGGFRQLARYEMKTGLNKNGFTLIEVLIAIILVGLAIASLVAANSSLTQANAAGINLSTAEFLSEQIRELTASLAAIDPNDAGPPLGPETGETLADYDDVDDFDGKTLSPPIGASREPLDLAGFSQQVTVENVNAADFNHVEADDTSRFIRITVKVFLNSREISSTSWIRALLPIP